MFFKRLLTVAALVFLALFLVLVTGCTSDEDSCNATLSAINSLENTADGRLKTMDIQSPDEFTSAQAVASKNQYYDAIYLLTSGNMQSCIPDVKYKNMVRSLELKAAFLDMYIRFGETEERISEMLAKSYPEFQKELKETMTDLENFRFEAKSLQIMADDIDVSQLEPANQNMMQVVENDLDTVLLKIDMYISLLVPYQ